MLYSCRQMACKLMDRASIMDRSGRNRHAFKLTLHVTSTCKYGTSADRAPLARIGCAGLLLVLDIYPADKSILGGLCTCSPGELARPLI
jgi:hypothetical protein